MPLRALPGSAALPPFPASGSAAAGWVALAAVWASILVAVVAAVVGVRRYVFGRRGEYTLVAPATAVKEGDV